MRHLTLIGMGTGNPDHLTRAAVRALNAVDLILIPRKGAGKEDLADLRRAICAEVVTNPEVRTLSFDLPVRDPHIADYETRVDRWHDAIAGVWAAAVASAPAPRARVALLVWGDPSLYDSTLRIAERLRPAPEVRVIPGITSLQALTAAHAIPLNPLAGAVTITTGRRLRDVGWPADAQRVAVMLDGDCAFRTLDPAGLHIWWGAYVGMREEALLSGPLAGVGPVIETRRAALRTAHGWIMDIYLLARERAGMPGV